MIYIELKIKNIRHLYECQYIYFEYPILVDDKSKRFFIKSYRYIEIRKRTFRPRKIYRFFPNIVHFATPPPKKNK